MAVATSTKTVIFFGLFGACYFLEAIGGFYMSSAVVYIEKQFRIPSRFSGLMVSAGDFAYIPVVLLSGYYGGKGNRAKWIGFGAFLIAISNLVISSSNFLFPSTPMIHSNGQNGTLGSDIRLLAALPFSFCASPSNAFSRETTARACKAELSSHGPFLTIFAGLLLLGVGRTMPFALGLPLIDDNARRRNLPLFYALMFFVRILGPLTGMLMGAVLNKIYYTFDPPAGLSNRDPAWIGAWWLGFLIFGCLLLPPACGLFGLSDWLVRSPASDQGDSSVAHMELENLNNTTPEKEVHNSPVVLNNRAERPRGLALVDRHVQNGGNSKSLGGSLSEFLGIIRELLHNRVYLASMVGRVIDVFAFKGFFVFLAKYLEIQFGATQAKVQLFLAGSGVIGFATGMTFGAVVMRWRRFNGQQAALFIGVASLLAAIAPLINSTTGCRSVLTDVAFSGRERHWNWTETCNSACDCEGQSLYPVCDSAGHAFYSPCLAGCPIPKDFNVSAVNTTVTFHNCSCTANGTASRDMCTHGQKCDTRFNVYFLISTLSGLVGGTAVVPSMLIILRCVKAEHRSVSLSLSGLVVSTLATLPSPIFWGQLIDWTCLRWAGEEGCGRGCQLYDADRLRIILHVTYGCLRILSLVSDLMVYFFIGPLPLTEEEETTAQNGTTHEAATAAAHTETTQPLTTPVKS